MAGQRAHPSARRWAGLLVLLGGFAVAVVVTTPVNKWMIGRGKRHAVVHALH
ncbi:hypothetical protein ACH4XT_33425 [Streptomyces avidinii]|uniref:hypothetical protein n=1 Tax=Streptomyces avidinii TaxID=1895 RepID=UPI00379DB4E4